MNDHRAAPPKAPFATLPIRSIGDKRLREVHFRALAIISFHDRMSVLRGGQGCWASIRKLAQLANLNYTSLCAALSDLVEWGFLLLEQHPLNRKQRVYRVNFESAPVRNSSEALGTVCRVENFPQENQADELSEYITPKRNKHSLKEERFSLNRMLEAKKQKRLSDAEVLNLIEGHLTGGNYSLDAQTEVLVRAIYNVHLVDDAQLAGQAADILERWGLMGDVV